ncbi:hypothetical protein TG4357_01257 [Thalassovita gelatinovora]|uniref:Uncharacterized protein n=1 Tax=Thalassovita gelatinovora TaxID=53501 RepID=A0A0P1FYD4_THAGE|nr:hypothetical protein [Thalassovita gelatinovora]QIZ81386.1 hypothetical protein HFZ77_13315 [Thalassovita gelatinovora]CUH64400.1 hypothetical protein TG4357_01257 [Thalassovita gelatinovora]SER20562.1 hypothetical protein SAMN04488043_1226 [Thalassovita gelatinovora]
MLDIVVFSGPLPPLGRGKAAPLRPEDNLADLVAFLTRAGIDVPDELDAM